MFGFYGSQKITKTDILLHLHQLDMHEICWNGPQELLNCPAVWFFTTWIVGLAHFVDVFIQYFGFQTRYLQNLTSSSATSEVTVQPKHRFLAQL